MPVICDNLENCLQNSKTKDQLIMTALFQQNAKEIQQNPSKTVTINTDFWAPDCRNMHVNRMLVFDYTVSLSTGLHSPLYLAEHLCATDPNSFWNRQGLWHCNWRQLLHPQRTLLKYVQLSLRTRGHCNNDRWPKKPEFLPAHSWVPLYHHVGIFHLM